MQTVNRLEQFQRDTRREQRIRRRRTRRIVYATACVAVGVCVTVTLWSTCGWPALLVGSFVSNALLAFQQR